MTEIAAGGIANAKGVERPGPLVEFWRYAWPIFVVMVLSLLLVTLFPPLATWLPNLIMG